MRSEHAACISETSELVLPVPFLPHRLASRPLKQTIMWRVKADNHLAQA